MGRNKWISPDTIVRYSAVVCCIFLTTFHVGWKQTISQLSDMTYYYHYYPDMNGLVGIYTDSLMVKLKVKHIKPPLRIRLSAYCIPRKPTAPSRQGRVRVKSSGLAVRLDSGVDERWIYNDVHLINSDIGIIMLAEHFRHRREGRILVPKDNAPVVGWYYIDFGWSCIDSDTLISIPHGDYNCKVINHYRGSLIVRTEYWTEDIGLIAWINKDPNQDLGLWALKEMVPD